MIESTVRPIEDTPWIPVDPKSEQSIKKQDEYEDISAFESKLLPLRVDLPPSLIPIHNSIFKSAPSCEWG